MTVTNQPMFKPITALPGVFLGTRYPDIRVLIPESIQDSYKKRGLWDYIVRCKFYNESDVIWFYDTKYRIYRKELWGYRYGGVPERYIKSDDWSRELPR